MRSKLSVFRQLCNLIPHHLVLKLARQHGVEQQARSFSPWSHLVALLYAQFTHAVGLNDVCAGLQLHSGPLAAVRGATPPSRNGLSHTNRQRDPQMVQDLFWQMPEHPKSSARPSPGGAGRRLAERLTRARHADGHHGCVTAPGLSSLVESVLLLTSLPMPDAATNLTPDPISASGPPGGAAFTTTHWSVVLEAGHEESPRATEALGQLCRTYWRPLYVYARKRGYSPDEAPDLVQEFFARVIEKNYFGAADRNRGRFRTFLLASMEHFLAKEWQRAHRLKRGGGCTFLSLDDASAETLYREEPADELTAEKLYDRRWALALLEQALGQLRAEYAGSGRGPLFEELAVVLYGDKPEVPYAELGARLGLTEGAVKVAVHRLRQRYGELVRARVADTVSRPEQVDEELQHLFAALGR